MISKTCVIYPNVIIGKNVIIEDFCIIGYSANGTYEETVISDNSIIRAQSIIYSGNKLGYNFTSGNRVNIRENNVIGDNVSIGTSSVIEHHIKIGNRVRVHSQVFIPEYSELEDDCWLGPNVVLTNAKFPVSPNVKKMLKGPIIKSKAKIGANSTILPNITIGYNTLIGAGSVVTKNTLDNSIYAGNPAKFIRDMDY